MAKLTREEIFQACDAIWQEGKIPTNSKVRARLGRGSFSTIAGYLREWKESSSDPNLEQVSGIEFPVSSEARELFDRLVKQLFYESSAVEESEQVRQLGEENDRLRNDCQNYSNEIAELRGFKQAFDFLRGDYDRALFELAAYKDGVSPDNKELIDSLQSENEMLKDQNQTLQTDLQAVRSASERYGEQTLQAREREQQSKLQLEESRSQLNLLQSEHKKLTDDNQTLRENLESATRRATELNFENNQLKQRVVVDVDVDTVSLRNRLRELESLNRDYLAEYDKLERYVTAVQWQLNSHLSENNVSRFDILAKVEEMRQAELEILEEEQQQLDEYYRDQGDETEHTHENDFDNVESELETLTLDALEQLSLEALRRYAQHQGITRHQISEFGDLRSKQAYVAALSQLLDSQNS